MTINVPDIVRDILVSLIEKYGDSLCSDINRLTGLLNDTCREYKKEITVLIAVMREGIIPNRRRVGAATLDLVSLSNRLYNTTGIDRSLGIWAIKVWANALGLEVSTTTILYCSFCGKSQYEVHKLIAGPACFICDECVKLCVGIINTKQEENEQKDPTTKNVEASADKLCEMKTSGLQSNPLPPRHVITPDSLSGLVESIREQGILEPIIVAKTPAGFQIIAGERRWRAAKILGLKKVPVVVKECTPQGMLEMSIVENIQREDLDPIEKALAYRRLIDEVGLGITEMAKRVGQSISAVANTIRLLSLPDAIKDALVVGVITEGHVRPLLSLGDKIGGKLFRLSSYIPQGPSDI